MSYTFAFFSDTHLGYATRCRVHPQSGLNMRVRDGYKGLRQTIDQILEHDVDLVVHGGDLFHRSHPSVADIAMARRQLQRLSDANIPFVGNTGNHDFANDRGKSPATEAVNDPTRGITMITDPYRVLRPADGVALHVVSHVGLAAAERTMPEPLDGHINLFTSHGAAQVPGHEIFACVDSPGEAVIGYDALTLPWEITMLGHYHGMGPLPGFDVGNTGQAWYAGSLLRRGFSDPQGGRGWLLVTVNDDGTVTVDRQYVDQREQYDLDLIDASGLTGADVEERIRANLASVNMAKEPILRQRVINCPLAVRRGVDTAALTDLASNALVWQLEFTRPAIAEFAELPEEHAAAGSLRTAGSSDLPAMWGQWFDGYAQQTGLSTEVRPAVAEAGAQILADVSNKQETQS